MISIRGLEKHKVLRALFNASHQQGMGFLHTEGAKPLTEEEAAALWQRYVNAGHTYLDYVRGRVMKVDLAGDEFEPRLYDRDNGDGAAERAIASLRKDG